MTADRSAVPGGPEELDAAATGIDTTVPHSARIWNYWLGGKDNFAVDRAAGDAWASTFPGITDIARASRDFLIRSIRYLAADAGIRQFLDIGTGLPTADNTHQVAQRIAPEAPKTLDFAKPVALILSGVLGHVTDIGEARSIVHRLMDALPSGSYLSLNDGTSVVGGEQHEQATEDYNQTGAVPYVQRTPEEIASFFDGLELVEPGVVSCPLWRPEASEGGPPAEVDAFGGVARKP